MNKILQATCLSIAAIALASVEIGAIAEDKQAKGAKELIQNIRVQKDISALGNFHREEQGKFLTGEHWAKATAAQKQEFTQGFQELFAKICFPKVRENFRNLTKIDYEPSTSENGYAYVRSVIQINHPVKKQELKLKFRLAQEGSQWRVIDVMVAEKSMLAGIRDEQIMPLLKDGGWNKLLKAIKDMRSEQASTKIK